MVTDSKLNPHQQLYDIVISLHTKSILCENPWTGIMSWSHQPDATLPFRTNYGGGFSDKSPMFATNSSTSSTLSECDTCSPWELSSIVWSAHSPRLPHAPPSPTPWRYCRV